MLGPGCGVGVLLSLWGISFRKMWQLAGGHNEIMKLIADQSLRIVRSIIKLVLVVVTAAIVFAVMAMGMIVALVLVLWSLLKGRRPTLFTHIMRFRQAAQAFSYGAGSNPAGQQASRGDLEVLDVQAREVQTVSDSNVRLESPKWRDG